MEHSRHSGLNRRLLTRIGVVASCLAFTEITYAESIKNLGVLPGKELSVASGISSDGSVVVGTSSGPGDAAFHWTESGGMQRVPTSSDADAFGVSADGSTVVGYGFTSNYTWAAFRWSATSGVSTFGNFGTTTLARATSADGSVTVGQYMAGGGAWRSFRFTSSLGFQDLGHSPTFNSSPAYAVSGDGSVIVGAYRNSDNVNHAYRWLSGSWQDLGRLAGGSTSTAYGLSADGSVVVGVSDSWNGQRAFRWTAATGMQSLGTIAGLYNSSATAVNGDGSVIVGTCDNVAFVWHDSVGMLSLQEYLVSRGVDLTGWSALTTANAISTNGRFVVGSGTFEGTNRGFIADIGVIPADCNSDGIIDYGQCHDGTLPDYNGNNIPDCCERGEACVVGNYPVQWRATESGNGHWYAHYGTPVNVSWSAFLAAGNACGGHVVSLSSQQEELFVYRQFGAAVIGLRANPGESSFAWIDDPSNTYSNWGTAFCPSGPYPNNPTTSERFVELQFANCPGSQGLTTKWDDYQSSEWPSSVNIIMEFDADCNNDGIVDYGQILTGQFVDANADGIPDICQQPTCRDADLFRNGVINGADLGILLSQWGPASAGTVSDINRDGQVNGADLGYLLNSWGACPN